MPQGKFIITRHETIKDYAHIVEVFLKETQSQGFNEGQIARATGLSVMQVGMGLKWLLAHDRVEFLAYKTEDTGSDL